MPRLPALIVLAAAALCSLLAPAAGTYTITTTGYPAAKITETGTLPGGLSFTDNGTGTGTISGTPTTSGTFSYTVTIKDSAGNTGTVNCSVTVNAPPTASCSRRSWRNPSSPAR